MLVSRFSPSFSLTPTEYRATADQMSLSPSHLPETLMRDCEEVCQCDNNYRNYTMRQLQNTHPPFWCSERHTGFTLK